MQTTVVCPADPVCLRTIFIFYLYHKEDTIIIRFKKFFILSVDSPSDVSAFASFLRQSFLCGILAKVADLLTETIRPNSPVAVRQFYHLSDCLV